MKTFQQILLLFAFANIVLGEQPTGKEKEVSGLIKPKNIGPRNQECAMGGPKCPEEEVDLPFCGKIAKEHSHLMYGSKCELDCDRATQAHLATCTSESPDYINWKKNLSINTTEDLMTGVFGLTSMPNLKDWSNYLTAMGYKSPIADVLKQFDAQLFIHSRENVHSIGYFYLNCGPAVRFAKMGDEVELGQECGIPTYNGTFSLEGRDTLVLNTDHKGYKGHHKFHFDKDGLTITWNVKNRKAVQKFMRDDFNTTNIEKDETWKELMEL